MVKIFAVENGSRASRAGILAGDVLISINNNPINDVLDYRFYLSERVVTLLCSRDGGEYSVTLKKGEYDDIGLEFETPLMDEKHSCKNKCIFCFIDQNPKGMRSPIYFKDDDSRLSFIHGNYITLTNMNDDDVKRIAKMRFSPLNISIHTTNPSLRVQMMKNKRSGEVLRYLDEFKKHGMKITGINPDTNLVEVVEIEDHPWYVASQYHPEYKSTVAKPHPMFVGFVGAMLKYHDTKEK